jgi:hypothetical protein
MFFLGNDTILHLNFVSVAIGYHKDCPIGLAFRTSVPKLLSLSTYLLVLINVT